MVSSSRCPIARNKTSPSHAIFPIFFFFALNLRRRGLESCFGVHHHPGGGIAKAIGQSSESAGLARQRDWGSSSGPGHGVGRLTEEVGTDPVTSGCNRDHDLDLHILANGRAEATFPQVGLGAFCGLRSGTVDVLWFGTDRGGGDFGPDVLWGVKGGRGFRRVRNWPDRTG